MEVALEVWSSQYPVVEATCRHAERLGFAAFYYGESPHDLNLDCWTTLAALARVTQRIRLGPVITNVLPPYRSHHLLARQVATVAAISDGRLDLRTGVGASVPFARPWWEPFGVTYPGYEQRLDDLRAALDVLPRHAGGVPIPLTIAASGERAMRLAAERADVWETSFCTPAEFRGRDARMAALAGGRTIGRSLEIDGFLTADERSWATLRDRVEAERGGVEDLGPVFERALVGPPGRAAERLAELAEAGVDQVVVALHDPTDLVALDALAAAVALA